MNKKEIAEIKKQFIPDNISIREICTAYVDYNKNVICSSVGQFLTLPEKEQFKYMHIFEKTLSGRLGKNLVQVPVVENGCKMWLDRIRKEMIWDDMVTRIIETYGFAENYMIVLIRGVYDIPGKSTAGDDMFDASDEVYDYIMCSLCPVNTGAAVLTYDSEQNKIKSREREFWVDEPVDGFLWPAFSDRSTDMDNMLIYKKSPEAKQIYLIESLTGRAELTTPKEERAEFEKILRNVFEKTPDYQTMRTIFRNLYEVQIETADDPELVKIGKKEIKHALTLAEISDQEMRRFETYYPEDRVFVLNNILDAKFKLKTDAAEIKVQPESMDNIETKVIDGQQWIMIPAAAAVEVNGICVDTVEHSKE